MNCKKCGAELAENAKFCTECGTSVAMAADTVPTEEVKEEVKQETEEVKAETTETKEEAKEESVEKVKEVKMAAQEETAKVEKAEEIKTEPTPMMTSKPKQGFQLDKKFVPWIAAVVVVAVALVVYFGFFSKPNSKAYATCTMSVKQKGANVNAITEIYGKADDKVDQIKFDVNVGVPIPEGQNIGDAQMLGVQSALSQAEKEIAKVPGFDQVELNAKKDGKNINMKMKFRIQYSKLDLTKLNSSKGSILGGKLGAASGLNERSIKAFKSLTNKQVVDQVKAQGFSCKVN